jgi:hypothetical protein
MQNEYYCCAEVSKRYLIDALSEQYAAIEKRPRHKTAVVDSQTIMQIRQSRHGGKRM